MIGTESVECKRFVLVKFDQKHRILVVLEHALCLIEETSVLEGGNKVSNAFPLNTYLGSEDIVGNCKHTWDDDVGATVQKGGKRRAEFADINDNTWRLSSGGKTPTTCDACVYCTKELFLGIGRRSAVQCNGYGHVLRVDQRLKSIEDSDTEICIPLFP